LTKRIKKAYSPTEFALKIIQREFDEYHKREVLNFEPNTSTDDVNLIGLFSRTGTNVKLEISNSLILPTEKLY
jgi:hypothetical protein